MKIMLYADAHFSQSSSIVLTGRLGSLVDSFKWLYELAERESVNLLINLGDLTDSPKLNSAEISAVSKALSFKRPFQEEIHILGNHERISEDGKVNSINFLDLTEGRHLVKDIVSKGNMTFIPYGNYSDGALDSVPDSEYAFTHIDIKGSDLGGWIQKTGMSIDYLMSKFSVVINGHIHKHSVVWSEPLTGKGIINLGSLSGQNFSSSGIPLIGILSNEGIDVSYMNFIELSGGSKLYLIENPYGIHFISKTCNSVSDIMKTVQGIHGKTAVQLKVPGNLLEDARNLLDRNSSVIASRIKLTGSEESVLTLEDAIESVDSDVQGFAKLREFINQKSKLPYDRDSILTVVDELAAVS